MVCPTAGHHRLKSGRAGKHASKRRVPTCEGKRKNNSQTNLAFCLMNDTMSCEEL